ncbi:MAG: EamA family transporter [Solirubrobacteraceae bacterium]
MLGLGLGLISSLCWGVSDFIGGLSARRLPLLFVMISSQAVGLAVVIGVVAIRGTSAPALVRLLPAVGGGLAGIAALTSFYRALAIGTMSVVAPIAATGVSVPVVVGIARGDRPAASQLIGIVIAVIGVVLASREHGPGVEDRGASSAGIALALLAAAGFGCYFVGVQSSARVDPMWALLASRVAGVALLLVVAAVKGGIAVGRSGRLWPLAVMGVLDVSATGLYAVATRHGLLSVVSVAASLYPLATVVLARVVLGERVRRVQEFGIAAALAGVVLMAAG